ncbi:MAG TPA: hydroxymethylbilane synthase [Ktedonosporobacter sp.]|jgi:hydroxymethylbilane synthase|nr:hydroxymethylbilane synthase [Ktedonosporobacter sp.]
MIQTNWVIERLRQQWPNLEIAIEQIHTTGDRVSTLPLARIGGDGIFVTEIEQALRERRIDLAIHSLKDLPTAQPDGLRVVVPGPREDVRDVFVSHVPFQISAQGIQFLAGGLSAPTMRREATNCGSSPLHRGSAGRLDSKTVMYNGYQSATPLRIGTCSLRRTAQVLALYPDAQILPLRGNIDTRLRKLENGDYDAILLASAGLHRMALQQRLAARLIYCPIEALLPAPGQGALGLEIRDEPEWKTLLAPLADPVVQAATSAERMFMRHLGAGCYLPVAAYGELVDGTLTVTGLVISLDGQRRIRVRQSRAWTPGCTLACAEQLGVDLAEQALDQGASEIIQAVNAIRLQER